jgi:hypothetical protein
VGLLAATHRARADRALAIRANCSAATRRAKAQPVLFGDLAASARQLTTMGPLRRQPVLDNHDSGACSGGGPVTSDHRARRTFSGQCSNHGPDEYGSTLMPTHPVSMPCFTWFKST